MMTFFCDLLTPLQPNEYTAIFVAKVSALAGYSLALPLIAVGRWDFDETISKSLHDCESPFQFIILSHFTPAGQP